MTEERSLPPINHKLFHGAINAWAKNTLAPRTNEDRWTHFEHLDEGGDSESPADMAIPEAIIADGKAGGHDVNRQLSESLSDHLIAENVPHGDSHSLKDGGPQRIETITDRFSMARGAIFNVEDDEGKQTFMSVIPDIHLHAPDAPMVDTLESHKNILFDHGYTTTVNDWDDKSASKRSQDSSIPWSWSTALSSEYDPAKGSALRFGYTVPTSMTRGRRAGAFHEATGLEADPEDVLNQLRPKDR
jgi:hypothetical protein